MYEIELHKDAVDVRMDEAERALDRLSLPSPPSHGKNHLAVTDAWQDGEVQVRKLLSAYIAGLHKNITDTRANINLLKRQDEVIR